MKVKFFFSHSSTFFIVFIFIILKKNWLWFVECSQCKSFTTSTIAACNLNWTGNRDTTGITYTKSNQSLKSLSTAVVSTDDFASDVPGSGKATNNNMILIVRGVIGLFLGILVLQMCVKLLMGRKKRNKREHSKRDSEKVKEEKYQELTRLRYRVQEKEIMNLVTWEKLKNTINLNMWIRILKRCPMKNWALD